MRPRDRRQDDDSGLVTVTSELDFAETVDRVSQRIERRDLMLVADIDHAANAYSVGLSLPPTRLFLFGNPEGGTPLMQASRSVAIDLPQKLLVWEDEGDVSLTYTDLHYLVHRHGIEGMDERLDAIDTALSELAAVAAGTENGESYPR